jgi:EAL domain-containing protein (putative c-di-GMP-specific phosphodiesterase class I)
LELLRRISQKINNFAAQGAVARPSKWEFVVCQDMEHTEQDFKENLNQLINELKQLLRAAESSIPCKLRTGVAVWPVDGASLDDVLSATEIALISAHQVGGAQSVWYQPAMRLQINELRQLADKIGASIEAGEFYFEYQPVVGKDLKSVEFYECLVRWKHPVLGELHPAKFIPLAIEHEHIIALTLWALRDAANFLKEVRVADRTRVRLSVNVAPAFITWMLKNQSVAIDFFEKLDFEAGSMILEITEESFLDSSRVVVNLLEKLKSKGFRIALDDFGAGYSSLSKIATLPFDYVKMDMSLVTGISTSEKKQKTCAAVIKLGQQLGIRVVAEGVETPAELAMLMAMGADFVQGFVISKPHSKIKVP